MIADSPLVRAFWQKGRVDDCPVIDMHGHMGPWPAIYFPRAEPEQMLPVSYTHLRAHET